MKISYILVVLLLTLSMGKFAYADHHESGEHCTRHHGMEWADANKDGAVSHEEFTAAHTARAEKMFEKLDVNKDGKIDDTERTTGKSKMGEHCKMKGDAK